MTLFGALEEARKATLKEAPLLANMDPSMAFILTQDDPLLASQSHIDLRLGPSKF